MPTLVLDQTYIYNGTFYGPGEVEIENEDALKAISAKLDAAKQNPPAVPAAPAADDDSAAQTRKR